MNLRVPGPTPLPSEVRQSLSQDMINHRGPKFESMLAEVSAALQQFFQTKSDVLVLTASGTGGLEAALVNVLSPGDHVLAASIGAFGDRFAEIARAYGARVQKVDSVWGSAQDVEALERALRADPDIRVLLTTHNETSTGVMNDLAPLAVLLRSLGPSRPLWLVDAVSSLGAVDLPMDEWGCDMVISASQKAWMAPPGLALMGVGPRAWEAMAQARCPRFYWDLGTARRYAGKGQTPFTPAVSVLYALRAALVMMSQEGLSAIVARHQRLAAQLREGLKDLGLQLFTEEKCASPTVTAVCTPEGVAATEVQRALREKHHVVVAAGMGAYKERVLRIAHMGYCSSADIEQVLAALRVVLEG
ncbi:MAG: alanine--glyoxylate aminotransferase family protein [Chloroflexi bacterium]|nr:alanine--glyoxylate aminotransferase family protein [Chloroflexota bacterium]